MGEPPADNRLLDALDRISVVSGRLTSWLTVVMVVVTFVIVVMRYVFDAGAVWLQESVVWMHAVVFMLGAAYTLQQDEHVRVDIFYREMSERRRAWVDLLGTLLFLLPLAICVLVCAFSLGWAAAGLEALLSGLSLTVVFMLLGIVWGGTWFCRWYVRKYYEPRQRELESLLQDLQSD